MKIEIPLQWTNRNLKNPVGAFSGKFAMEISFKLQKKQTEMTSRQ